MVASLGVVALSEGQVDEAQELLRWIEGSATSEGYWPEQVADDVSSPYMFAFWRQRWGATATPLLWSHAMHLVLLDGLGSRR